MKIDMSVEQAAKMLRDAAQLTSQASKNWDNYQKICEGVIQDALDAGRKFGQEENG